MIKEDFEEFAHGNGVNLLGYADIPEEFKLSHMFETTIVGIIKKDKKYSKEDNSEEYDEYTELLIELCDFIEKRGYHTFLVNKENLDIDSSEIIQSSKLHNLDNEISSDYDVNVDNDEVFFISTDMPVDYKNLPKHLKPIIEKYCKKCYNCVNNCPQHALYLVDGEIRYDKEKCLGFGESCIECIKGCPFYVEKPEK